MTAFLGLGVQQWKIQSAILESISSGSQERNIENLISFYEFAESIYNHSIHGRIILNDGIGLMNNENFSITGEEFITITVINSDNQSFEYKFMISNIELEVKSDSSDSAALVIQLISVDTFTNTFSYKSRGYINNTIKDIVTRILDEELESTVNRNIFMDTEGVRTIGFTKLRPFEKINMLLQQSFENTTQSPSSTFFFYEDRSGYNFRSFENIISESKSNTSPITLSYSQLAGTQFVSNSSFVPIKSYLPTTRMDNFSRLSNGFYSSEIYRFDFLQKRVTNEYYNAYKDVKNFEHVTGDSQNTNSFTLNVSEEFAEKIAKAGSYTYFIPWSSENNDMTYKWFQYSTPLLMLLQENTLNLVTEGIFNIKIGDPVNIEIGDNRPPNDPTKDLDMRYSGRYIVQSINHTYNLGEYGDLKYNSNISVTRELMPIPQSIHNKQVPGNINIPSLRT